MKAGPTADVLHRAEALQLGYDVRLRAGDAVFVQVGNSIPEHIRFSTAFERLVTPAGVAVSG